MKKSRSTETQIVSILTQVWLESGTVYGYSKVIDDLRDVSEACSKHRVARLMKKEGLQAQMG